MSTATIQLLAQPRRWILLVVVAVLSTTTALIAGSAPAGALDPGEVGVPAPVRGLPICQTIPDPDVGGCFEKSDYFSVSASGSVDASGVTTVQIVPTISACSTLDWPVGWTPSSCYSGVKIAQNTGLRCLWLDDATGDLSGCPSLYRGDHRSLSAQFTREQVRNIWSGNNTRVPNCSVEANFNAFYLGGTGPTTTHPDLPNLRWATLGPQALTCELTLDGPTPDNLMGASWLFISARLEVQHAGQGNLGTWEIAEGYVSINGFLGPDAPGPTTQGPAGPNIPGTDPEPVGPFTDIPAGSFARADVKLIYDLGITKGVSATQYGPQSDVTREQMAAFLARLWRVVGETCPSDPAPFTDTGGSFAEADAACIYALGITTGTSATTFEPGGKVTREQMAAFLARLWRALGNTCPNNGTLFTDIASSFAKADIECIWALGITKGTSTFTFSPGDPVTREQMAAFLARTYRLVMGL